MKILKRSLIYLLLVIITFFQYLVPIKAASDLIVSSTVTISGTSKAYGNIIIRKGGKLSINSSNITIEADYLQVDAGGEITYHSNQNSSQMSIVFNINGDTVINGNILLRGVNGANGGRSGDDGANGGSGKDGKNLVLNVNGKFSCGGVINTTGGTGGRGGDGHDDDELFDDPLGEGGNGGAGGKGGSIDITAGEIVINSGGQLIATGGTGGRGGDGGDGGSFGDGEDGGNGGNGGRGGTINLNALNGSFRNIGTIHANGGTGGGKGYGGDGGLFGDDGSDGSGGSTGDAGYINITSRYFNNTGTIRATGRSNHQPVITIGYGDNSGTISPAPKWYKDKKGPIPDGILTVDINNSGSDEKGILYINDHTPYLTWTAFKDVDEYQDGRLVPPSGLKQYEVLISKNGQRIDIKGVSEVPNVVYSNEIQLKRTSSSILEDGIYEVQIKGSDYANNQSAVYPLTPAKFVIDTQPPTAPVLLSETEVTQTRATINWEPSIDNNAIDCYELQVLMETEDGGSELLTEIKKLGQTLTFYPLHELKKVNSTENITFSPNQKLLYQLRAKDIAGNYSMWSRRSVVTVPTATAITAMDSGWDYHLHKHFIILNVKSVGDQAEKYRYIREKRITEDGQTKYVTDFISEWFGISSPADSIFKIRDTGEQIEVMIGDDETLLFNGSVISSTIAPHNEYRCFIETKNASTEEYDWNTQKSLPCALTIKNTPPLEQGVISPRHGCRLNKEEVELKIKPFIDPDGDDLSYLFYVGYDNNNDGVFSEEEYIEVGQVKDREMSEIAVTTKLLQEGEYRWYVKVSDGYLTEPVQSQVYNFEKDVTPPSISFGIYDELGIQEIEATNKKKIKISDLSLCQDTVEIRILEGDKLLYKDRIRPFEDIEITISDGEGSKAITFEATDEAGNSASLTKNIIYDLTPPAAPTDLRIRGGRNRLFIDWDSAQDNGAPENSSGVKGYLLTYKSVETDEEVQEVFVEQSEMPSYTIINLGNNQQRQISIRTQDRAGNYSAQMLTGVGCSLAEKGVINSITFQPATTYTEYSAVLQIQQVEADQYTIRRWTVELDENGEENLVNQIDTEWRNITDSPYIDDNILPHTKYYYSIITRNSQGEVESDSDLIKYEFTVVNQEPSVPVIEDLIYTRFIPVVLRTGPATDTDGDPLQYFFTLKDDSGKILIDNAPANNPDDPDGLSYIIPQDLLNEEKNGEIFYWQVGVTDGYMFDEQQNPLYVYSQEGRVTIDTVAPEVLVSPEDLTEYRSELELDITVIDQISGIKQVVYYWNQEDVSPQDRDSTVLELDGGQEYQFKITDVPIGRNNLYLTVSDLAGNENIKTFVCKLDLTPPLISNLTVNGEEIFGRLYTTNSSGITAEWEIIEDYTDIDYFRYAVITPAEMDKVESLPAERFAVVDEYFPKTRKKFAQVAANCVLVENNTYHFAVEAVNTAGLSSGIQVSPGVTIDSKPPQIGVIDFGDNVIAYNDKYYLSHLSGLSVDVDINDHGGSGIKEVKYALTEEGSEQAKITWYDSIEELKTAQSIMDGTVYSLIVKATDCLNQERIRSSDSIIIDTTAPVVEELIAGSRLVITEPEHVYEIRTGSHIPISLRIEDQIDLASIEYAIGTDVGKNNVTAAIYPESSGWIPLDSLEHRQQFIIAEELPDGIYYINLQVKNVAGLVTVAGSNPVKVDSSLSERPIVWDDGEFTTNNNELHFSWTFANAPQVVQAYEYRIYEVSQGEKRDLTGKHRITPEKQGEVYNYTVTGLSLADGNGYYIELRAVYQDGTTSLEQMTDGIIVDTTFPEEIYIEDGSYSTSDSIYLYWGAKDRESGIAGYQIKIGTSPGGAEITGDWIPLDQTGQGRLLNLPFIQTDDAVYYTTLKVTNGAGLTREVSSDGFRIDDTPPPVPIVLDQGRYTSDEPIHLDFTWKWSEVDPDSGISHYEIALLTTRQVDALTEWTNLGKQTEVTFTEGLVEGIWYYLAVKAVNGVGLSTIGMSDGILIDTSAPSPPQISDEADYLQIDPSGYTALRAIFTASDDESDIDYYEYSLGTLEQPDALLSGRKVEAEQIITEKLPLSPGEIYYFTVRAINKAGLVSMESRSDGVMIIDGYPEITEVNDFGDYTTFNDQIIVTWECLHTGYAPIDYYQVELSTNRQTWIKVKEVTEEQVSIVPSDLAWASFEDGVTYFVSIRGVNKAGVITPAGKAGISDGIKVDNSPPGISDLRIIHTDQYTTNRFKIHLQANDSHSGITAYSYAIGKTRGGTEVTGGWVLRETSTLNFEEELELKLEHNKRYYVTFQARNGTGLWSKPVSDEGIIADLTPPEIVDFSCSDYLNSTGKVQLWWKTLDPETGVTGYRYQIVETRDNPDLSSARIYETTEEEVFTEVSVPENLIIEGTRYYLALQVRNRLGVWSPISYKEFTVDTLCPIITIKNSQEEIVTNDGKAELLWNITEQAEVEYGLYRILADAQEEYVSGGVLAVDNPTIEQIYRFEEDEHVPATYYLKLVPTDLAGNRGTPVLQYIRVNAKPSVNIGLNRTIYKGRELQLSAVVDDPDGRVVAYSWDFGDGATSTEAAPVHSYSELGEYIVTLFCTDNNGGVGTDTIRVTVTNTFSGTLTMDEVWSGKIKLSDTVIVPAGVRLLIMPGTVIESPADKGLIIDGSLVVQGMTGQEVIFTIDPDYAQQMKWKGIRINPGFEEVVMNCAHINRAERGVTIIQRNMDLHGLQLTENYVGIHLYNASPGIRNCIIADNELYGIKEDRDCEPLLINNIFSNNYVGDYYDSVLTILLPEELQELNRE